jgi:small subunit ribosomal protein S5
MAKKQLNRSVEGAVERNENRDSRRGPRTPREGGAPGEETQVQPPGGDRPGGRDGGRGRDGRDRRGGRDRQQEDAGEQLDERVVDITRVAKVIKGGRRFAFRTVVIVGDNKGRVGIGVGKSRAVPDGIRKGGDRAKKNMQKVSLAGTTIPHEAYAEYGGAKVLLRPAAPGTGVIAAGGVRAVLEAVGVRDVLSKSQGSSNLLNVAMATIEALLQLRSPEKLAAMRGKHADQMRPFWERRKETK